MTRLAAVAVLAWTAGSAAAVRAEATSPMQGGQAAGAVSLTGQPGDPLRGRAIVVSRQRGLCLLCHSGPFPEERFQGTLAPSLAGVGTRWSEGELRQRLIDPRAFNPDTIMPPYFRTDGLTRVGTAWQGRPVLGAQEIEDVVAFLVTLREERE